MTTNNGNGNKVCPKSANNVGLLEAKYYCMAKNKKVDVVMELKTSDKFEQSDLPQRFVLVIDVSGSMGDPITKDDPRSLLDRMKNFANLFIDYASNKTCLSIVQFSLEAEILLPMKQMNDINKVEAKHIIANMNANGGTNLSAALTTALDATECEGQKSYDCIILFTDGDANEGTVTPDGLVEEYNQKMRSLKRVNKVQIATITIGDYRPYLLKEIARRLSSDAFYWLNYEFDFEADIMMPVFLREKTSITDITVDLSCLNGVTFVKDSESSNGFPKKFGDDEMTYFICFLPKSTRISFSIDISRMKAQEKYMLKVKKSYLDHKLEKQEEIDYLPLSLTSMKDIRNEEKNLPDANREALTFLENTSAYIWSEQISLVSWTNAQISYANVMEQICLQLTISSVKTILEYDGNATRTTAPFLDVIEKINTIKEEAAVILGKRNLHCKAFNKNVNEYIENLEFSSKNFGSLNWARLSAMESSLTMEMPAATGVFSAEAPQLFMPPEIESKLVECAKILNQHYGRPPNEATKQKEKEYERRKNLNYSHKKLLDAMISRDAQALIDSLNLCRKHGVDKEEIEDGEALLKVVQEEDQLIFQIKELVKQKDSSKLQEAIRYFKSHQSQFVDKSGEFEKAEIFLEQLLEKERLKQALENTLKQYGDALLTKNTDLLKEVIEKLKNLAAEGANFDRNIIAEAKQNLETISIELENRKRMDEIKEHVSKSYKDENIESLKNWIEEMEDLSKTEHFVITDEDSKFLASSYANMQNLVKKQTIQQNLQKLRTLLSIPLVPESLERLIAGVSEIKKLKDAALDLVGAFTSEDENLLAKVRSNIEHLQMNIEKRDAARQRLQVAMEERNYNDLVEAIKDVDEALFIENNETHDAKELADFINPSLRINALEEALKSLDISEIESAINDFQSAKVKDRSDLLDKAEEELDKLIKKQKFEDIKRRCKQAIKNRDEKITAEMISELEHLANEGFAFKKKIITDFKNELKRIQKENANYKELEKIYGPKKKSKK